MSNEELHERTVLAVARCACSPFATSEDLELICWHSGIKLQEINGVQVTGQQLAKHKVYDRANLEQQLRDWTPEEA